MLVSWRVYPISKINLTANINSKTLKHKTEFLNPKVYTHFNRLPDFFDTQSLHPKCLSKSQKVELESVTKKKTAVRFHDTVLDK